MFVCVGGKNNISVDILEYLIKNNRNRYELGVVCNKSETGRNTFQKSLRYFSHRYKVKEYRLEEIYNKDQVIFLSLEFDQILKPENFKDARLYNVHFSLLPKYKGMYTSIIPILNAEKYTGVTLHEIDSGIDTGNIIAQKKFEIKEDINSREIYFLYMEYATKLMLEYIEDILGNRVYGVPQAPNSSTYYPKNYIDFTKIVINLNQTADCIRRQINAYCFREYQMPIVYNKSIIAAKVTNIKSKIKPGQILLTDCHGIMISTIDYNIILYFDRLEELFQACEKGDITKVKEICIVKEHIDVSNENGWTPLMMATYYNYKEIVKYLLLEGADIYARDYNGTTILMYAKEVFLKYQDRELFDKFLDLGLDIYQCDYQGNSVENSFCK